MVCWRGMSAIKQSPAKEPGQVFQVPAMAFQHHADQPTEQQHGFAAGEWR